ncbi:MAG: hypothetical protein M3N35_14000 [Candidatus Binatota bacterium]|nr:hypothetical protein [Candidatus Binatota bacterium]
MKPLYRVFTIVRFLPDLSACPFERGTKRVEPRLHSAGNIVFECLRQPDPPRQPCIQISAFNTPVVRLRPDGKLIYASNVAPEPSVVQHK